MSFDSSRLRNRVALFERGARYGVSLLRHNTIQRETKATRLGRNN